MSSGSYCLILKITCFLILPFSLTVQNKKYILQWTNSNHDPFLSMGVGQQGFIDRNCTFKNCFMTNQKDLFDDRKHFDAVLFYGPDLENYSKEMLPQDRSAHQKYVFVSDKPSEEFPVSLPIFDGFFNWTWTYKLDSDLIWRHMVVTDLNGTLIGPQFHINWIKRENMAPVNRNLRMILKRKKKAVFWMHLDCDYESDSAVKVKELKALLKSRFGESLDIFGKCSDLKCIRSNTYNYIIEIDECDALIRNDYYFYIAYEEYMNDYVTEVILPALKYNAIPIVYGGANYTRFLPNGSYLNARELSTESLALKIYQLINNHTEYVEYFKWTNHYKYYSSLEYKDSNQYCELCALLNNQKKVKKYEMYKDFRSWWNRNQFGRKTGFIRDKLNKYVNVENFDSLIEEE